LTEAIGEFNVGGATESETELLFELACRALHCVRAFIAWGGSAGGGAAYLRCADALAKASTESRSEGAEAALIRGMEAPARCLLAQLDRPAEEVFRVLRHDPSLVFDVERQAILTWENDGPLEPAPLLKAVIRQAGQTAATLLEKIAMM
jgi:chaperonin GroEL (HSP60 family)